MGSTAVEARVGVQETPARSPRAARFAVATAFLVNGSVFANWVPLIPTVQTKLGLSNGTLGAALLGAALGALVTMPLAGWVSTRVGSRLVTVVAGLVFCSSLPLLVLAPSLPLLFLALVVFGAGNGAMDVAMNAQGVAVERRYGRPIMSSFHGLWSLGGFAGALISGALARLQVAPLPHALVAAPVLAIVLLVSARYLLPADTDDSRQEKEHGPAFARLPRALIGLGIVGFCSLVAEGSIGDWSAIFLRRFLGADAALGAAGYAAFAATMTVGRLTGDRVTARLGPVITVRIGGILLAVGLGTVLVVGQPIAALVGFGLVGFGLANIVPILFSAAGRSPHMAPGPAIAAISTASYLGFLAGPPAIGFTADHITLRGALLIVVAFGIIIAALAGAVNPPASNTA